MRTIDVTESEPSLIASAIECECGSMMPGITNLPVASMTCAPAGAVRFLPICAILPFCRSRSVFSSLPLVTVRIVAFLISVAPRVRDRLAARPRAPAAARRPAVEVSCHISNYNS